jgi:hypothetical protein
MMLMKYVRYGNAGSGSGMDLEFLEYNGSNW